MPTDDTRPDPLREALERWLAALIHEADGHKRPLGYRGKGETMRGDDLCDYVARLRVGELFDSEDFRRALAASGAVTEDEWMARVLRRNAMPDAGPWASALDENRDEWLRKARPFVRSARAEFGDARLSGVTDRPTHGRHCPCSACAREDWTNPNLADCGTHGPSCPREYAPKGADHAD